jgi:hypothetical protein
MLESSTKPELPKVQHRNGLRSSSNQAVLRFLLKLSKVRMITFPPNWRIIGDSPEKPEKEASRTVKDFNLLAPAYN